MNYWELEELWISAMFARDKHGIVDPFSVYLAADHSPQNCGSLLLFLCIDKQQPDTMFGKILEAF